MVYDAFLRMTSFLRSNADSPVCISNFESHMDTIVIAAWEEQRIICCDQILKRRISTK